MTDTSDIVLTAVGILNRWAWPSIPGLDKFEGQKAHTAHWDNSIDLADKEVALIGAGSSGIQVLPTIQPIVERVDHYVKGKNWIYPYGVCQEQLNERGVTDSNNCR
jgi:cation diffusion facilitator CzcD-associated flavoprotein CzcO